EMIASAAAQEDVDVIGLSILSGAHNTLCPRLMELLRGKGMNDVTVLIGGIIPEADIPALKKGGIAEVFLPGTTTQSIVDFIRQRVTTAPHGA
ncbi:MAG: cobalamin-dependent protein, partial [Candidatus Acidiferrales bacterium]